MDPLHCSCLENPRDGEAWWAAVYGGRTESDTTKAMQWRWQQQSLWTFGADYSLLRSTVLCMEEC